MQKYVSVDIRPRLLAVLAHPDDESFGMGGTLAWYADCGAAVYLVCATHGEAGSVDEHHLKAYGSIAELREAELRCAAEALGLTDTFFLPYRDSGMAGSPDNQHPQALCRAPMEDVIGHVVQHIRLLRPHVILTFDPIGGYRHPDHIAIQQATERAFYAAGDPQAYPSDLPAYQPQKLYFHTFPRAFLRLVVRMMPLFGKDPHRFGRNHDIDLVSIAVEDFPVHARIDYLPVANRKLIAASCHASQGGGAAIGRGIFSWALRLVGYRERETFMRAYPPPEPRLFERDLFAGVRI